MKDFNSFRRNQSFVDTIALFIFGGGVLLRLLFWQIHLPIWKHYAVFILTKMPLFEYIGNFQSYSAVRMPFYDLFAAMFYLIFRPAFGIRSLTLFSVVISIISLPLLYISVRKLFNEYTALFALSFYAFYPKFLVLTAQGFPEAASVGFMILALYCVCRGDATAQEWFLIGGISALLAYLMFIPAVAFGILLTFYIYVTEFTEVPSTFTDLLPGFPTVIFSIPPGAVGLLYLIYGPVQTALSTTTGGWTNMRTSLFIETATYSLGERIFRYIGYMYFDFWSLQRGFDKERHILRKIDSMSAFFGDFFPIAIAGWIGATGVLTIMILYGLYRLSIRQNLQDLLVLSWVSIFLLFYTSRNAGWTGVFQTRHVFPLFPAIAIVFGVGASTILRQFRSHVAIRPRMSQIYFFANNTHATALVIVVLFCLFPLVGASGFEGTYVGEHHTVAEQQPTQELMATISSGDTVGVVTIDEYYDTVLYSEGSVWPVILIPSSDSQNAVDVWTVIAESRVVAPAALNSTSIDYLYISECGDLTERQEDYARAARRVSTSSYLNNVSRGPGRCSVHVHIYRLSDNS